MDLSLARFSFGRGLTLATLAALALGAALGALLPPTVQGAGGVAVGALEAVGAAWVRALRMVVLPLVVSLLVLAVLSGRERAGVARMGAAAVGIYLAAYAILALLAAALYPALARAFGVARGAATIPHPGPEASPPPAGLDVAAWLVESLPANPFAAAAEENLIQVVLFSLLFAAAAARLAPAARRTLSVFFAPVAEAMLVIVAWLLRASPVAVFALALAATREVGLDVARALLAFALAASLVMLLAALALAPVAGILGRVGTIRFARAAWPGQLVGLATRSSLAALPALVEEAASRLRLPDRVIGFGLPFAASTFKPSRILSETGKLLFLAWIYGLSIGPIGYAGFVGYVTLLAATTVGVPNPRSGMASLPAYLALGVPIEGVVLIDSVDMLWDHAATVLNATGYLAVTVLLPRGSDRLVAGESLPGRPSAAGGP